MTSSSSTSNNSDDPILSIPSLSNFPFTISIKLSSSNYPFWKAQTLPYFRGYGVFGYLDGQSPFPHKKLILFILAQVLVSKSQILNMLNGFVRILSFLPPSMPHSLRTSSLKLFLIPHPVMFGLP